MKAYSVLRDYNPLLETTTSNIIVSMFRVYKL